MKHLRFDMYSAEGHPQEVMKNLGITYQHATPQSMGDQWWFWNCVNIPDPLPKFLEFADWNPMEMIGWGLSEEDAIKIRDCKEQDMLDKLAKQKQKENKIENMKNNIEITTAINLENYKKNSLLVAKIDPEMLKSQESIDALRRTMDDLRKKVDLDDSTTLFLTPEEFDVEAFDEEEMAEMGWIRKEEKSKT